MAAELLTPGKGKFRIKKVKTHDDYGACLTTKKGDRKVMIIVEATDSKGAKGAVFEHLTMNVGWKVELICKACNLGHLFISDAMCLEKLDELEGAVGECIIGRQDADGQWPERTTIAKYVVPKASKSPEVQESDYTDDQLPF